MAHNPEVEGSKELCSEIPSRAIVLLLMKVSSMKRFDKLLELIEKLRSESGCPWDRGQTIKTLKADLLSEAKEVGEAIDKEEYENLKEEVGDLIWSAALITQVAKEEKLFDMDDVLATVNEKMVRRHPHVFGDVKAKSGEEAKRLFYEAKTNEKKNKENQNI